MVTESSALVSVPRLQEGHLKKHIATVFIQGNLTSLERKLWNLFDQKRLPKIEGLRAT